MKAHLSIVAGLVVGVVVAGLVLGGLVALATDPPPLATPPPPAVATPSPPPAVVTPSPSAPPSTPPGASPAASANAATGPFHVGPPRPALVVPQVGGGTNDLPNLEGMASGFKTALARVNVTP